MEKKSEIEGSYALYSKNPIETNAIEEEGDKNEAENKDLY